VRELDVLLLEIEKLNGSGRYPGRALGRVAAAVAEERDAARTRLEAKLPVSALHRLAAKIDKIARALKEKDADPRRARPALRAWRWAIDARIARRSTTLGAAIHDAGALYLPERLHQVRIGVKKLRYALEMLADVTGAKTTPDLRQLRRTQDYLGRLHDLQVLMDRVRQVQASLTPPDLAAWRELDVLVASLEDQCRRLHGRYMREHDALAALAARLSGRGVQLAARRSAARRAS
jgi:CHAD domain-containing protein